MDPEHDAPVVALVPPSCCGAAYFRRLRRALPDRIEVRAVELPGHGRRYAESFLLDAPEAVADLRGRLGEGVDLVYGESLGAYLGLAAVAAWDGDRPPVLVAASNTPPSAQRVVGPADVATPAAAVATLTALGGAVPPEALEDPAVAASAHRMIRGDLLLSASLVTALRGARVDGDLTVLRGAGDPSLSGLHGWARHAAGGCSVTVLPGGHLLAGTNPHGVAGALVSVLEGLPGAGGCSRPHGKDPGDHARRTGARAG